MGVPAPSATLVRLRDGVEMHSSDGTFHLVHLGPEHAGLYLLNVTNVVGHQSLSFSLSVSIQGETTERYSHKKTCGHTHSLSVPHTNEWFIYIIDTQKTCCIDTFTVQ